MDSNKNTVIHQENEIDLRDLIMSLWKKRILIMSIALITALLTCLYSKFVIQPVYQSTFNVVVSMPETYITKYGEYTMPITTNQQYIDFITSNDVLLNTMKDMGYDTKNTTLEGMKGSIKVEPVDQSEEQIKYKITVSTHDAQEALKLAQTLYRNYSEFIDVMLEEKAVNYYYDQFTVSINTLHDRIETNNNLIEENEKLLEDTPQTIDQKQAMDEINNSKNQSDFIVLENIINPNYTQLENTIITLKQSVNTDETSVQMYARYLNELRTEKDAITKYFETGKESKLESTLIGVDNIYIYMPSQPVVPSQKSSPSVGKNTVIGALLGGMLAVFAVLAREYWVGQKTK